MLTNSKLGIVTAAWSVLAVIGLAAPGTIIVGLHLGVIPGLLLVIAPTVALYFLVLLLVRLALNRGTGVVATVVAAAVALAFGGTAGFALRRSDEARYRATVLADVQPARRLSLRGHVVLERAREVAAPRERDGRTCDAVCAAVLATPGVESVTLIDGTHAPATVRFAPFASGAGLAILSDPETILDYLPRRSAAPGDPKRAITLGWLSRLAKVNLVVAAAAPHLDLTVRMVDVHP